MIRRLHVPLRAPEEVIPHLGAAHHWKEGRSAKSLVDQGWAANDIPASLRALLNEAEEWSGAELIDAFVERCTDLTDGRTTHSQSDLLAIVGLRGGLGVLGIEAKVDEGFDKTLDEWRRVESVGKGVRLDKLCRLLSLDPAKVGSLRYQLFHRTASAVIEAKRYRAHNAAMIVQSWSPAAHGFDDFARFCVSLGLTEPELNRLTPPIQIDGVSLRMGWSCSLPSTM